tara:strand:+ start:4468 stop:5175 length:708 start_codon:yes stop_codon:yes gene_type:complete
MTKRDTQQYIQKIIGSPWYTGFFCGVVFFVLFGAGVWQFIAHWQSETHQLETLTQERRTQLGIKWANRLHKNPFSPESQLNNAVIWMEKGHYEKALYLLESPELSLQNHASRWSLYAALNRVICYRKQLRLEEAFSLLLKLKESYARQYSQGSVMSRLYIKENVRIQRLIDQEFSAMGKLVVVPYLLTGNGVLDTIPSVSFLEKERHIKKVLAREKAVLKKEKRDRLMRLRGKVL